MLADNHRVMQFLRAPTTRRRVERLIRQGVGVREAAWQLPIDDTDNRQALVEQILAWVRDSMAAMRRPYGIDQVALALACRDAAGRVVCSNSFGVVHPALFYGAEGADRIASFFGDLGAVPLASRHEVVGALLSLGDIAYELSLPRAA
ncbi:MAG: hypothetical protein IT304_06255 [Dehalococcoidia bacterium]|nr:hypothetical protein [Dehalococcoidia bacterium]